ncbi:centrosomal protein CEP57L1 [Bombina bombina]|uniref:centrosomal protein CEP57L1 n=1 Tax=Bombina bombina TaxID=8345 RepID=UPI00235ADE44|nr:centrosomal protein CEP57L1 [Bombina bombina]
MDKPYIMDSMLKDSYLGSFCQPPNSFPFDNFDSKSLPSKHFPSSNIKHTNPQSYDILQAPNGKALLSALRTLQEKVCRLEQEKSHAYHHITSLSKEATQEKTSDGCGRPHEKQQNDTAIQLDAVQQRCTLLEKQLDYMRKMIRNAEMEKNLLLQQESLHQEDNTHDTIQVQSKLEKLDILERECSHLKATQKLAENKLHQLEEKLSAEEQQRKMMQDKAAQIQTGLEESKRLMSSVSTKNAPEKKERKKKKKLSKNKETHHPTFYPRAGDLPFVAGKSTSSSHSLSANVQTVLHMMKHQSQRVSPRRPVSAVCKTYRMPKSNWGRIPTATSKATDSLSDLLLALQDELEQMSFEHQDLLKQIHETQNHEIREDLERELEYLVKQMETKSDQILKLKQHQENVVKLKKRVQTTKIPATSAQSAEDKNIRSSEVQVTPRKNQAILTKSTPIPRSKTSLDLLKNVQKIQMTLKKDDIMWEK